MIYCYCMCLCKRKCKDLTQDIDSNLHKKISKQENNTDTENNLKPETSENINNFEKIILTSREKDQNKIEEDQTKNELYSQYFMLKQYGKKLKNKKKEILIKLKNISKELQNNKKKSEKLEDKIFNLLDFEEDKNTEIAQDNIQYYYNQQISLHISIHTDHIKISYNDNIYIITSSQMMNIFLHYFNKYDNLIKENLIPIKRVNYILLIRCLIKAIAIDSLLNYKKNHHKEYSILYKSISYSFKIEFLKLIQDNQLDQLEFNEFVQALNYIIKNILNNIEQSYLTNIQEWQYCIDMINYYLINDKSNF